MWGRDAESSLNCVGFEVYGSPGGGRFWCPVRNTGLQLEIVVQKYGTEVMCGDVNLCICDGMEEAEIVGGRVIAICPERSLLDFSLWRENQMALSEHLDGARAALRTGFSLGRA